MKKGLFFLLFIIAIILVIITIKLSDNKIKKNDIAKYNAEFEKYQDKTLYGADVMTIINKAIDNNKNYEVEKDSEGYYIENDTNSLKIELILLSTDEKGQVIEVKHQMETLEKAGLDGFISSFSLTAFEITNIEYNSIGRISKILVKQLEI